jgi:hypothetical protein
MVAALAGAALLGLLALLQVLLIAGAPLGRLAWGGQHVVLPTSLRIGSAVAIALYAAFAGLMLQAAGVVAVVPPAVAGVAIWVLTAYFALGVTMNAASRSRPERLVMTPVVLVLAVLCLVLALQ